MVIPTLENFITGKVSARRYLNCVEKLLLAQGRKSVKPDGRSAYRGENGCSCAIGLTIPDKTYSPSFDRVNGSHRSYGIVGLLGRFPNTFHPDDNIQVDGCSLETFLAHIQLVHDKAPQTAAQGFNEHIIEGFNALREQFHLVR